MNHLSRRTLLRGLGAALSLPLLETMSRGTAQAISETAAPQCLLHASPLTRRAHRVPGHTESLQPTAAGKVPAHAARSQIVREPRAPHSPSRAPMATLRLRPRLPRLRPRDSVCTDRAPFRRHERASRFPRHTRHASRPDQTPLRKCGPPVRDPVAARPLHPRSHKAIWRCSSERRANTRG